MILENLAPVFNVEDAIFNLTLGSLFEYTISATDGNGDSLNIRAEGLLAGATATRNGDSLTFSWTPNNANSVRTKKWWGNLYCSCVTQNQAIFHYGCFAQAGGATQRSHVCSGVVRARQEVKMSFNFHGVHVRTLGLKLSNRTMTMDAQNVSSFHA